MAHDKKKDDLIRLVRAYAHILKHHQLFATGTTGKRVAEATGLPVHCYKSGPLGGDQEIGAAVARGEMDMILFFRDPLTAQPHEPDVSALMRLCDVYSIPLATNMGGSEILVRSIAQGDFEARTLDHNDEPPA
ncbi:MAG: methylglyoxal synthase [Exiguobacterium sp.]|nr:methylglyoxal synthase [Exiguobacterium sp.]MDX5425591.1 methylglyoxal synthase [Exiguobacterium sp.]MDX6772992.1 methylglyoxal synthase [Exiguobacterium sp.]